MKRKKRQGIVLITTLLFVTIIVMIATMIAAQGKAALQSGTASMQAEEAYMAALSGIEVVRGELKRDKAFGATSYNFTDGEDSRFSEGLKLMYAGRNIIGKIGGTDTNPDYKSKFVISFSKTNNNSVDNSAMSNNKHVTDEFCKYLSVNNLNSSSDVSRDMSKGIRRDVPSNTIYIVSKGVCGKSVRYAEAFLTSDGPSAIDGGSQIGGDINITGASNVLYGEGDKGDKKYLLNLSHVNNSNQQYADKPGLLSAFDPSNGKCNKNINLNGNSGNIDKYLNLSNEVYLNSLTVNGMNSEAINKYKQENKQNNEKIGNLTHSSSSIAGVEEIKSLNFENAKEDLVDPNLQTNELDSGCYIYLQYDDYQDTKEKESEVNNPVWIHVDYNPTKLANGKLDYSDLMEYLDSQGGYQSLVSSKKIQNTPNSSIKFGGNSNINTRTVEVTGNINSKADVNFLCVDYKPSANDNTSSDEGGTTNNKEEKGTFSLSDSSVDFNLISDSGNNSEYNKNGVSVINSGGKINIRGEVTGKGSLVATGDVHFNAGSNLEVGDQKVAVYSGGNVNIEKATDLSMRTHETNLVNLLNSSDSSEATSSESGSSDSSAGRLSVDNKNDIIKQLSVGDVSNRVKTGESKFKQKNQQTTFSGYSFEEGNWGGDKCLNIKNSSGQLIGCVKIKSVEGNNFTSGHVRTFKDNIEIPQGSGSNVVISNDLDSVAGGKFYITDRNAGEGDRNYTDFNLYYKKDNKTIYYLGSVDYQGDNTTDGAFKSVSFFRPNGNSDHSGVDMKYSQTISKSFPDGNSESSTTGENATADPVYDYIDTITSKVKESSTNVTGTLYAKGKINIDASDSDLNVIGSLISLNGLNINNVNTCNLIYDPNYVPFFKEIGINTNVEFVSSFVGGE